MGLRQESLLLFRLRLSAWSARDIGVSLVIAWVLSHEYSPADSADHAEEYSKAVLFRRERLFVVWVMLGFRLRLSARDIGVSWMIDWVFLREYSPADYADHAERMQQAVLFRRERHIGVSVVLGFVCVICEICGRHWGFLGDWLNTLMWIFSRR